MKQFILIFKKEVDKILKSNLISGRKNLKILYYSEWTYLVNIAIYNTIREYNDKNDCSYSITPEAGGRFPSDFFIKNEDDEIELIIEHENSGKKIEYNFKKLLKYPDVEKRLLICYVKDSSLIESKIQQLKRKKSKSKLTNKGIDVLIAAKSNSEIFTDSKQFKRITLH